MPMIMCMTSSAQVTVPLAVLTFLFAITVMEHASWSWSTILAYAAVALGCLLFSHMLRSPWAEVQRLAGRGDEVGLFSTACFPTLRQMLEALGNEALAQELVKHPKWYESPARFRWQHLRENKCLCNKDGEDASRLLQ